MRFRNRLPSLEVAAQPAAGFGLRKSAGRAGQRPYRDQALPPLLAFLVAVGIIGGLVWRYQATALPVTVQVDSFQAVLSTHQRTVGDLLTEIGLALEAEDRLWPAPETPISQGLSVQIERARPLLLQGDSRLRVVRTHALTLAEALEDAGVSLGPADELFLEGQPALPGATLPAMQFQDKRLLPGLPRAHPWQDIAIQPVHISLRRAVPLILQEDGPPITLWTTASTVGDALAREGLYYYAGDRILPGLGTPVSAGLRIHVERSRPVVIESQAGRALWRTRTRRETVADLLAEQGLTLTGQDRIDPPLDTPVSDDLIVRITRVQHAFSVDEKITPFASVWEPDPELEIDTRSLEQEGAAGIVRSRYRTIIENGEPVLTTLEDRWLAQEPITRVLKYGTKIVLREVETPEGPQPYWRKIRMFATSYTAADAGVSPDAPYYGITRLGWKMRGGIVAVDPFVVRLGSQVFVPGYGIGDAADTGGLIKGRWIDLGYEVGQSVPWSRCVDVYLLAPAPPTYQIEYRLPNYPNVPCLRR